MAEDLGTRPEDARVAALIAAAERLATPLDLDRLDRRPVRRGGALAAIVVAGALLALVAVTAFSGGDDATADDTSTPTTVARSQATRAEGPPTTTGEVALAASAGPVPATTTPRQTDNSEGTTSATTTARSPGGAPASSPNASLPGAATTQPVATTAAPVPAPGNLPGSTPPSSSPGSIFTATGAGAVTLGAGGAPAGARSIVFAGGVLHLGGRVPDRETAEELEANVAVAAFGRAMISAEYIVDEDASEAATEVLTTEGTTLFLPESEDITPAASALLDFGAALLREHPRMRWTVEVHTDNLGSDEYNLTLSQRRADAIVAGLVARGADPAQLLAVGKGEGEPIADNATRAGREANRRVEIDIDGLLD